MCNREQMPQEQFQRVQMTIETEMRSKIECASKSEILSIRLLSRIVNGTAGAWNIQYEIWER